MATMYRYQLPVEQTGWTLQGEVAGRDHRAPREERLARRHAAPHGDAVPPRRALVGDQRPAHQLYQRLGFQRTPHLDWSPAPGVDLLAFRMDL